MADETETDVTLFRGAADNPYFEVYFNAVATRAAEGLEPEVRAVDLRPERDVTLHVEVYNPEATIPLVVTPGGMGECDGFRGFARNVAAAAPDIRVIIWDRRNMGRSQVNFGSEPMTAEEAEDLHVLAQRLGLGPTTYYGMSSGARSNLVMAERYPNDVAALVIAPLTGGPLAASRLPGEYYLKYPADETLTSMGALAQTPLWAAYIDRNDEANVQRFLDQDIDHFLEAMQRSGDFLASFAHQTALGMTDERLEALDVDGALILHHGRVDDPLHPIPNGRAATTLLNNSTFHVAPTLDEILELLLPFVRQHSVPLDG